MKKDRKIVWIKSNKDVKHCPMRIVEKYIRLLPRSGVKHNIYLHSLRRTKPSQWYSETPLGINKVRSVVKEMLKDAGLDGFFTNYSLHRTAATCLFQAGQNVKLIKEITGHVSDAVEKYEITSDKQRMDLSSIIQGEQIGEEPKRKEESRGEVGVSEMEINLREVNKSETKHDIANVIDSAVRAVGQRKARITVHIDTLE